MEDVYNNEHLIFVLLILFQTYVENVGERVKIPPGISRLLSEIEAKLQRLPPLPPTNSMTAIPMEIPVKLPDAPGSGISRMAATQLEILISQLGHKIATKIQRLYLCFRGSAIQ